MPNKANNNKETIIQLITEVWNQGILEICDKIFSENYTGNSRIYSRLPRGPEGFKQFCRMFRAGNPELHYEIEDIFCDDDKLAVRVKATGIFVASSFDKDKRIGDLSDADGIMIYRFEDGKIAENWSQWNTRMRIGSDRVTPLN